MYACRAPPPHSSSRLAWMTGCESVTITIIATLVTSAPQQPSDVNVNNMTIKPCINILLCYALLCYTVLCGAGLCSVCCRCMFNEVIIKLILSRKFNAIYTIYTCKWPPRCYHRCRLPLARVVADILQWLELKLNKKYLIKLCGSMCWRMIQICMRAKLLTISALHWQP